MFRSPAGLALPTLRRYAYLPASTLLAGVRLRQLYGRRYLLLLLRLGPNASRRHHHHHHSSRSLRLLHSFPFPRTDNSGISNLSGHGLITTLCDYAPRLPALIV